jgi:hypothetical protein
MPKECRAANGDTVLIARSIVLAVARVDRSVLSPGYGGEAFGSYESKAPRSAVSSESFSRWVRMSFIMAPKAVLRQWSIFAFCTPEASAE